MPFLCMEALQELPLFSIDALQELPMHTISCSLISPLNYVSVVSKILKENKNEGKFAVRRRPKTIVRFMHSVFFFHIYVNFHDMMTLCDNQSFLA